MEAHTVLPRGKVNIIKMFIWLKAIYTVDAISIEIQMAFSPELEQISKIFMGPQNTLNTYSNLEKEEQSWRYPATWYQIILQDYSNQNSMVLA